MAGRPGIPHWALILGFTLSAIVQAVVRRSTIVRLLGDDRPRTLARAAAFGVASSSCSYAAVALARSLFRQGATFIFGGLGLIPDRAGAKIPDQGVAWDYTTWLNIVFGLVAVILVVRFVRAGGVPMLRMMGGGADGGRDGHGHHMHAGHGEHAA